MIDAKDAPSTRPYLLRALYEWCADNGFTPYVAVMVDETVQVPMEYVKNGEIVLNISMDATKGLKLGNDYLEFKGRFGGVARDILVPVGRIMAIYARENGQGMAFPLEADARVPESDHKQAPGGPTVALTSVGGNSEGHGSAETRPGQDPELPRPPSGGGNRPALTRVK